MYLPMFMCVCMCVWLYGKKIPIWEYLLYSCMDMHYQIFVYTSSLGHHRRKLEEPFHLRNCFLLGLRDRCFGWNGGRKAGGDNIAFQLGINDGRRRGLRERERERERDSERGREALSRTHTTHQIFVDTLLMGYESKRPFNVASACLLRMRYFFPVDFLWEFDHVWSGSGVNNAFEFIFIFYDFTIMLACKIYDLTHLPMYLRLLVV